MHMVTQRVFGKDALNYSVGEDSWESPGLQVDQTSQS